MHFAPIETLKSFEYVKGSIIILNSLVSPTAISCSIIDIFANDLNEIGKGIIYVNYDMSISGMTESNNKLEIEVF